MSETYEKTVKELGRVYNQMAMNMLTSWGKTDELFNGEIIGYRKVKVPRYFRIKIPVISKAYDDDSEYGTGEFEGWLISFKEISLFRIGTDIEKRPIRKKLKDQVITWKRYEPLKTAIEQNVKEENVPSI